MVIIVILVAIMYVEHVKSRQGKKVYTQILLRESYREKGAKRSLVKHRTLMNLTRCGPEDVRAIEWGLKHKKEIEGFEQLGKAQVVLRQDFAVGAVWVLWHVAKRIGLLQVLGRGRLARLGLWLVFARLIGQGSRLSAVRLACSHAVCEILGVEGFSEYDLYNAMDWLDKRQQLIETGLFRRRLSKQFSNLFLYDVTSSYLEGDCNAYGFYGYPRDGKRGKKQVVVGLLTDEEGVPVSIKVFKGNTQDPKTVTSQIHKIAREFGIEEVTFVGDRGMIKSAQIEELNNSSFHYITALTKPQIESLIKKDIFQLDLFDKDVFEVKLGRTRYILRCNPFRKEEISAVRKDKFKALCCRAEERNAYLTNHPCAQTQVAERIVREYAEKLKIHKWVDICVEGRRILVTGDDDKLEEVSRLDGCYVLKSDVPPDKATAEQLHDRYKDLQKVEKAFRTMKSAYLELRPWFVRTHAHTRAHAFIVMLAYRIDIELENAWKKFDLTVEEGINDLSSLCAIDVNIGEGGYITVPKPRENVAQLMEALELKLPTVLPRRKGKVAMKRTLKSRRK